MKRLLIIIVLWTLALVLLITWETLALPAERSSRWDAVRDRYAKAHPTCEVCDGKPVQIHHIKPVHLWPELELDPDGDNLIALCAVHHFWTAHLGDFKAYNPTVREDAAAWKEKIKNRRYER